ncbi:MAG: hypothetical protein HC896_13900 [Bacteroidales bacterium]|nr:hypothetical protein [Bacteroidales bacterium]
MKKKEDKITAKVLRRKTQPATVNVSWHADWLQQLKTLSCAYHKELLLFAFY